MLRISNFSFFLFNIKLTYSSSLYTNIDYISASKFFKTQFSLASRFDLKTIKIYSLNCQTNSLERTMSSEATAANYNYFKLIACIKRYWHKYYCEFKWYSLYKSINISHMLNIQRRNIRHNTCSPLYNMMIEFFSSLFLFR